MNKLIMFIAIILLAGCYAFGGIMIDDYTNSKLKATFTLIGNSADGKSFTASISLKNGTVKDIKSWVLCLDFCRPFTIAGNSRKDVRMKKSVGEYYEIAGLAPLAAGATVTFNIDGKWFIRKYTDTPICYFLVDENGKPFPVNAVADISCLEGTLQSSDKPMPDELNKDLPETIRLIPAPAEVEMDSGTIDFVGVKSIDDSACGDKYSETIKVFLSEFAPIVSGKIISYPPKDNATTGRKLIVVNDHSLGIDEYVINISDDGITLSANSKGGVLYGLVTIFKLAENCYMQIPCMKIHDYPKFKYRGTLLDVARNFKTTDEVKKWILMSAFYKLNVFHIHLSDDEGWRLEIKKYPNLNKIGAFRGYGEPLPMLSGSGFAKSGGFYTQNEMKDIIDYANKLNVTVIPEIDVPGHARALIVSFDNFGGKGNNPLVEKEDKSVYSTPQNYSDNVLNPAIEQTYVILDNIFKEMADLFQVQVSRGMAFSGYIHVGSDEVPKGAWEGSPLNIDLKKKTNIKTVPEMQAYFLLRLQDILSKYKYKIAGWDEAAETGKLDKNKLLVTSWNGVETGRKAAEKGYQTVMTPAEYLYFDLAYNSDVSEPGYYWAGFVDAKRIYSYIPITADMSQSIIGNIVGIQGSLWGDTLVHPRLNVRKKLTGNYLDSPVEYMGFPKMTALSEVAWTPDSKRSWKSFAKRYDDDRKILDKFDIAYREKGLH